MIYNSFNFIVIFPLIFLLYYLIPARNNRARILFLLIASISLYASWNPLLILVLGGAIIISYSVARAFDIVDKRKGVLIMGIVLTILPLLLFKYFNFFNEAIHSILLSIGVKYEQRGLNWAIPVGVSFFTLQAVSYIADVYLKKIKAEKDILIYALYLSFFPSIMMGPINRASMILPQLKSTRTYFDYSKAVEGLKLLLWGMFMKVVVADRTGIYVDTIYENYQIYSGSTCFIASILYSIQIYCDFAGYSLMALGVGKTLGFEIAENFRRPYFSETVNEFWKRWHISLSTWLRDYIYIPLGGNRIGQIKTYRNLIITFLISGLWHGANWTFIIWGITHAIWMIIERLLTISNISKNRLSKAFKVVTTFLFVNFAWILFHSPDLNGALSFLIQMTTFKNFFIVNGPSSITIIMILVMLVKDIKDEYYPKSLSLLNNRYMIVRWAVYIGLISIILLEGVLDTGQFIYANF